MVRLVRLVLDETWTAENAALVLRSEFVDSQLRQARTHDLPAPRSPR